MKISSAKNRFAGSFLAFSIAIFSALPTYALDRSDSLSTDDSAPCATRPPVDKEYKQCPLIFWKDVDEASYISVRANPGNAYFPIDVPVSATLNACWYVDNKSTDSFFVPFKSPVEWNSFITSALSGGDISVLANLVGCARQTLASVEPNNSCSNASAEGEPIEDVPVTFALPYERIATTPVVYPQPAYVKVFKCNGTSLQIVSMTWAAKKRSPNQAPPPSGVYWPFDTSGWVAKSASYTPGGCGPANGVATSDAPDDDALCSGTGVVASNLKRGTPWTWSCRSTGTDGVTEVVSCQAPLKPECGHAAGRVTPSIPKEGLCISGKASMVIPKASVWRWTCTGSTVVTCTAPIGRDGDDKTEGCGPSAGRAWGVAPTTGLCLSGGTASPVSHVDAAKPAKPYWLWRCKFPDRTFTCTARDCGCD
ncbi:MAG: hypothetical protein PHW76_04320 [Alphaproteobacteria bacterium]|nr:hypothetical protein [Alphaproteobacteria bacterium]